MGAFGKWLAITLSIISLSGCTTTTHLGRKRIAINDYLTQNFYYLRSLNRRIALPYAVMSRTIDRNCYSLYPDCREYHSTACINGKIYMVYGTACLQPDCTWRAVS